MATLAVTQISPVTGGLVSLAAAAGGGDKVPPGDTTWLHVKNGGGSPITVTLTTTVANNQGTMVDGGGSVAAGAERLFGPLKASRFASLTDGLVAIGYSGVTSVTVGAFSV